jgi:glycerol-3-phosphate dehydrogenase (NAD(P)+)
VLMLSKGLVPPLGSLPSAYVAERTRAWAVGALGGPGHASDALAAGASLVLATPNESFARQVGHALAAAGFDVTTTADVIGVELAGCAKNAAALAAAAANAAGPNAAGAAAGKVFAEVEGLARRRGARPETFAGLAGTGDLVATVLAAEGRSRRAGELLAAGVPADEVAPILGHAAEAVDAVPLLAGVLRDEGLQAPAVGALAELVEGRIEPETWSAAVTAPAPRARKARAA